MRGVGELIMESDICLLINGRSHMINIKLELMELLRQNLTNFRIKLCVGEKESIV